VAFTFDKEAHRYELNGRVLISNTDILEAAGFSDYSNVPPAKLHAAAVLGKWVHEATLLMDQGKPWSKRFPMASGYVEGWRSFKKDFHFKPKIREVPMYHPVSLIPTTPDAFGESDEGLITVEIKTCPVQDHVGLQTAFQECVLAAHGHIPDYNGKSTDRRYGVELRPDGTYQIRKFNDPNDIKVFHSAATVILYKRAHGIIK
jgi:hypothetical protein